MLSALTDFAFRETELRRLEQEIDRAWQVAEAHIPFTHQVDASAVKHWPEINAMTELVTRCRMRFARLAPWLEKPSMALSGPARRLAAQLIGQVGIADRLEAADDVLEVLEDLYELATTAFRSSATSAVSILSNFGLSFYCWSRWCCCSGSCISQIDPCRRLTLCAGEARVNGKGRASQHPAALLPLPVVSHGEAEKAVPAAERLVGHDRGVTVAEAAEGDLHEAQQSRQPRAR